MLANRDNMIKSYSFSNTSFSLLVRSMRASLALSLSLKLYIHDDWNGTIVCTYSIDYSIFIDI